MYFMMSVKDEMKQNHPNGEWTQLAKLIGVSHVSDLLVPLMMPLYHSD
jgi:hypothetical protein